RTLCAASQPPPRPSGDATSSPAQSGHERPDITGQGGESSITGDAVASARGEGAGAAGHGAGAADGEGDGVGSGSAGSGDPSSSGEGRSNGSGGRGGGPRGYRPSGGAPPARETTGR